MILKTNKKTEEKKSENKFTFKNKVTNKSA